MYVFSEPSQILDGIYNSLQTMTEEGTSKNKEGKQIVNIKYTNLEMCVKCLNFHVSIIHLYIIFTLTV